MMKKLYIYLLAAAAAVVSCAKENFVEPSENNFRIAVAETAPTNWTTVTGLSGNGARTKYPFS